MACPRYQGQSLPSISCKVTDDNGTVYDLSDLKELANNYEVAIDKNRSIILNICHPIVYGYRAVCLDNSGACLRINSDKLRYNYNCYSFKVVETNSLYSCIYLQFFITQL